MGENRTTSPLLKGISMSPLHEVSRGERPLRRAIASSICVMMFGFALSSVTPAASQAVCGGLVVGIMGTAESDVLVGTLGPDIIHGSGGDDVILGMGGDDVICGGPGSDLIEGNEGSDRIYGGAGRDRIEGNGDNDRIEGGAGVDTIFGGDGHDVISGDAGRDRLYGDGGNDVINGRRGADLINGDDGIDVIDGGGGPDELSGGASSDTVYGKRGADRILGGSGSDTLFGNGGGDFIDGGAGADTVSGQGNDDALVGNADLDVINGGGGNDACEGLGGVEVTEDCEFGFVAASREVTVTFDTSLVGLPDASALIGRNLEFEEVIEEQVTLGEVTLQDGSTLLVFSCAAAEAEPTLVNLPCEDITQVSVQAGLNIGEVALDGSIQLTVTVPLNKLRFVVPPVVEPAPGFCTYLAEGILEEDLGAITLPIVAVCPQI